jgi:hypothetical protein
MAGKTGYPYIAPPECKHDHGPSNEKFWIGLIACVLVAIAAQAHTMPEPWSHIVSGAGTVGAAINGFLIRR